MTATLLMEMVVADYVKFNLVLIVQLPPLAYQLVFSRRTFLSP